MEHKLIAPTKVTTILKIQTSQRAHHVKSTSIRRGCYGDRSKTKFQRISTSFPRTFSINFTDRKIHVVSTYFFRCNFDGRKIHVVSTYFFRCNFDGLKIHLVSTYFFRCNFFCQNIHDVLTFFDVILLLNNPLCLQLLFSTKF